ncbi:MAG: hypothetical protein QM796_04540, partial [Chthoniobacteraceae bacterium]
MPQLSLSLLFGVVMAGNLLAAPLTIDLTPLPAAPHEAPYGPGTNKNPQGVTITADSESFFLNGKPWIPIAGEFHYSRYPRAEWQVLFGFYLVSLINLSNTQLNQVDY